MSQKVRTHVYLDGNLKLKASSLFKELGLSLSDAVNLFLSQAITEKGIPFKIYLPSKDTTKAIDEVENGDVEETSILQLMIDSKENEIIPKKFKPLLEKSKFSLDAECQKLILCRHWKEILDGESIEGYIQAKHEWLEKYKAKNKGKVKDFLECNLKAMIEAKYFECSITYAILRQVNLDIETMYKHYELEYKSSQNQQDNNSTKLDFVQYINGELIITDLFRVNMDGFCKL